MILNKSYNIIMEKVKVTPEMRERILNNIQVKNKKSKKIVILKYLSMVACLTLVVSVGAYIYNKNNLTEKNPTDNTQIANGIEEVSTLEELSEKVGFEVTELPNIPFDVVQVTYLSYWNSMSDIRYLGDNQEFTFRKAQGNQDISGDYNYYENIIEENINDTTFTLKGNNDTFNCIIWYKDDFSYSLYIENGLSLEDIKNILENV